MAAVNNWAEVPEGILDNISAQLIKSYSVGDLVRFGGVCHSWRSVAEFAANKLHHQDHHPSWGPWLMLHEKKKEETPTPTKTTRRFYEISTKQIIELHLPEAQGRRCFGSPHGWLLTFGNDLKINLLNPFTRRQISLPPQSTLQSDRISYSREYLRSHFITNFCLSSHDPTTNNSVVMVTYGEHPKVAIARPGESTCWATIKVLEVEETRPNLGYDDIIFFNNIFYLVDRNGNVHYSDVNVTKILPLMSRPIPNFPKENFDDHFYLVEISGELCIVVRILLIDDDEAVRRIYQDEDENEDEDGDDDDDDEDDDEDEYEGPVAFPDFRARTTDFEVFKLDFSTKSWVTLHTLGDHALFLGSNISFAISTSHRPQFKSNAIYFTDDFFHLGGCDIGLFDFQEKKLSDPFYCGKDIRSAYCPALFFTPNLQLVVKAQC